MAQRFKQRQFKMYKNQKSTMPKFSFSSVAFLWIAITSIIAAGLSGQDDTSRSTKKLTASKTVANDFAAISEQLKPLFDESLIAFAHFDLKALPQKELGEKLNMLLPSDPDLLEDSDSLINRILKLQKGVIEAGGQHLFATFSLIDLSGFPVVVAIPGLERSAMQKLAQQLESEEWFGLRPFELRRSKMLIVCRPEVHRRIESGESSMRTDALSLLKKHVGGIGSVHLVPTRDHLRVVRELTPQFAEPFEKIKGDDLADGIRSISVSLEKVAPIKVTANIRSANDAAAAKLSTIIEQAKRYVGGNDVKGLVLKGVLAQLEFENVEKGLRLNIGEQEEQLWIAMRPVLDSANSSLIRTSQVKQLRQIMVGIQNFHDAFGAFPDLGNPIRTDLGSGLSWRVHILQLMGHTELYQQFHLDENWDSDHNKKLIAQIPMVFMPKDVTVERGKTLFVMPRGKEYFARPFPTERDDPKSEIRARRFRDLLDGSSNTIGVIPVAKSKAVIWTKPEDWEPKDKSPLDGIIEEGRRTVTFAMVDGSTKTVNLRELSGEKFLAWLTIAGGEIVQE